jgi:hypothetical protein
MIMEIPRRILGYSNADHRVNPDSAEINYAVPFIGQNHGNMCADASIGMLLRWAGIHDPNDDNLNVFSMTSGNTGALHTAVQRFEKLPEDKLRNEAIRIFDTFLTPEAPRSILQPEEIDTHGDEYEYLAFIIANCKAVKAARDAQYGGGFSLTKRWQRHATKREGIIIQKNTFRGFMTALRDKYVNGPYSAEFIRNPRTLPITPMTLSDLRAKPYFSQLKQRPYTTTKNLCEEIYCGGPVVAVIQNNAVVPHAILLKGFDMASHQFLIHDPWRGRNRGINMDEFWRIKKMGVGVQIREITPIMLNCVLGERLPYEPA